MKHLTIAELEEIPKEFLSTNEVCEALGISHHSFYKYRIELNFPVLKIGRVYRIPKQPFIEFLKKGKVD